MSLSSSNNTCSVCREEIQSENFVNFCCEDYDESHEPICNVCMCGFITRKVSESYLGTCPILKCPLTHSNGTSRNLDFSKWTKASWLTSETIKKYKNLANSTLAFLCGGCHSLKSISVAANPISTAQQETAWLTISSAMQRFGNGNSVEQFRFQLEGYRIGLVNLENIFESIMRNYLPMLASFSDRDAWELFKNILIMIDDPSLQANLHLRYLRARPRIWTPCCNREHCFKCKTKDFHNGRSCDENTATLDGSIVNCPSCGISIAKGDGCNSITCVCGKQFSWSMEKENQDRSIRFLHSYPVQTSEQCVTVLCSSDTANQSELLRDALAWQTRNRFEVDRKLLDWWNKKYNNCPSQACLVVGSQGSSEGARQALDLWSTVRHHELEKCKKEALSARRSLFATMFPVAKNRPIAAVNLLQRIAPTRNAIDPDADSGMQLRASARLWVDDNAAEYEAAVDARETGLGAQFLFLYGGRRVSALKEVSLGVPAATEWDRAISNSALTYSNCDTTVQRVGSVSSYPAAFAQLPSTHCMFSVRIDVAPRGPNWLTFGLARRPMQNVGSDGVGRTMDTWGINDDRASSRDARVSSCGTEVGMFRKLREGDLLTAVVDTHEGWVELSLNEAEVVQRLHIPRSDPDDYYFAMTFATDHQVSIVSMFDCPLLDLKRRVGSQNQLHESAMKPAMESKGGYLSTADPPTVDAYSVVLNRDHAKMFMALKSRLRKIATSADLVDPASMPVSFTSSSSDASPASSMLNLNLMTCGSLLGEKTIPQVPDAAEDTPINPLYVNVTLSYTTAMASKWLVLHDCSFQRASKAAQQIEPLLTAIVGTAGRDSMKYSSISRVLEFCSVSSTAQPSSPIMMKPAEKFGACPGEEAPIGT